jgi:hypothetical protein
MKSLIYFTCWLIIGCIGLSLLPATQSYPSQEEFHPPLRKDLQGYCHSAIIPTPTLTIKETSYSMNFSGKDRQGYTAYVVLASHPIIDITDDLLLITAALSYEDWMALVPQYTYQDEFWVTYGKIAGFYEQIATIGTHMYFATFCVNHSLGFRSSLSSSQAFPIPKQYLFPDSTEPSAPPQLPSPLQTPSPPPSTSQPESDGQDSWDLVFILFAFGVIAAIIITSNLFYPSEDATAEINAHFKEERATRKQRILDRKRQKALQEQSTILENPFLEDPTILPLILSTFPRLYIETQHEMLEFVINKMGDLSPEATSGPLLNAQLTAIAQGLLVLSYKEGALYVYRNGGKNRIRSYKGLTIFTPSENEEMLNFLFSVLETSVQVALAGAVRWNFEEIFSEENKVPSEEI